MRWLPLFPTRARRDSIPAGVSKELASNEVADYFYCKLRGEITAPRWLFTRRKKEHKIKPPGLRMVTVLWMLQERLLEARNLSCMKWKALNRTLITMEVDGDFSFKTPLLYCCFFILLVFWLFWEVPEEFRFSSLNVN